MSTELLDAPSTEAAPLREHFAALIEQIARGAVGREAERRVPTSEIRALFDVGIGRLRIPVAHGGFGASLRQSTELFIELAAADSNIVQALHGHQGFVENILLNQDPTVRDHWFPLLVGGAILGDAQSERSGVRSTWKTTFTRDLDGHITVTGEKFYTTGSLYADWALVGGKDTAGAPVTALVKTDQPGVKIVDDWNGFGQKLTGSGSAYFTEAVVEPENLFEADPEGYKKHIQGVMYQHNLHIALAGIARAVLRDGLAYVLGRTRHLSNPELRAGQDPFVQQILGRLHAISRIVEATVLNAAQLLDAASEALHRGENAADLVTEADTEVYSTQSLIVELVQEATTKLFDLGGATAVASDRQLDRHWRNARVIANHNSALHRSAVIGQYLLGGPTPTEAFLKTFATEPPPEYVDLTAVKEQP